MRTPSVAALLLIASSVSFESNAIAPEEQTEEIQDVTCKRAKAPADFAIRGGTGNNKLGVPINSGIFPNGFVDVADAIAVVHGIDVSKYQDEADFQSVYECGGRFVYVRLSGGTDPDNELLYRTHWANTRAAKLLPGPYHNLSGLPKAANRLQGSSAEEISQGVSRLMSIADSSARRQARMFITRLEEVLLLDPIIDNLAPQYLPPVLDLSYNPYPNGTAAQKQAYGKLYGVMTCSFMDEFKKSRFKAAPLMIFVDPATYAQYKLSSAPCDMSEPLVWIRSRPTDGMPFYSKMSHSEHESFCLAGTKVPRHLSQRSRCLFEQYTSYGGFAVFGENAPLDLNRFFGTESDLAKLLTGAPSP